ncbi:hypothetical protein [Amycolatopsis sp. FDAARGOS 1241]|uniref:hypothetical protein n=1 Tax=Amycolatopsis sp. FDAARGOS 1241 TaxID=2778070 RepID=UPI00194EDE06|nr:hypothetical protein [Amycolatopsis sp. FDAARGOS 1241]QRP50500.1 hypothetical protein I6J71_24095 [Amycolatopsis sp. FDAARGOS 1241]
MRNTLSELGALHLIRPTAGAAPHAWAAWHERRALVLDALAADGSTLAATSAAAAHRKAAELREGAGGAPARPRPPGAPSPRTGA